jgi:predicted ribonuclease YlaK
MAPKDRREVVITPLDDYDPKIPFQKSPSSFPANITAKDLERLMKRKNGDGFDHEVFLVHPDYSESLNRPEIPLRTLLRQEQSVVHDDTAFSGQFRVLDVKNSDLLERFESGGVLPPEEILDADDPNKLIANQCCVLKLNSSEHDPRFELAVFKAQSELFVRVPKPYKISGKISPFNVELAFARYLMHDSSVGAVTLFGPAGTGKTTMAIHSALELFLSGEIASIDIYKSTNQAAGQQENGALPGNADQKFSEFRKPVQDTLDRVLKDFSHALKTRSVLNSPQNGGGKKGQLASPYTDRYRQMGLPITITSPAYLRGGELRKRVVIIEEAQNYTSDLVLLVGTRLGKGSRLFVIGDNRQVDNHRVNERTNGLADMMKKLNNHENYGQVELTQCLREGVAKMFVERYYPPKK